MRAVLQRVLSADITINGAKGAGIGRGLVILLGIKEDDTQDDCQKLAEKCAHLRIFDDENGNLNLAATDLGYEALVVSNFTLYGDSKKGKRPSFAKAAKQPLSENLYNAFVKQLRATPLAQVQTGTFGADMQIALINDGPVTLVLDTEEWKSRA